MNRRTVGLLAALSIAAAALLAAAPTFASSQRFVAPGGATSANDCTSAANPCDLRHAIHDAAQDTDEVILAPGTYNVSGSEIATPSEGLDIHGPPGTTSAHIVADTTPSAVHLQIPHLHDLWITQSAGGSFAVDGDTSVPGIVGMENVRVEATGGAHGVRAEHTLSAPN